VLVSGERGTPQGGLVSPWLSNILRTPFGQEMCRKGHPLTRFCRRLGGDLYCRSTVEVRAAMAAILRTLSELSVQLPQKTPVVQVQRGSEFTSSAAGQDRHGCQSGGLYAYPARNRSSLSLRMGVRQLTRRGVPLKTKDLIEQTQPSLADVGSLLHSLQMCPTSERSSTNSTLGSSGALGRIRTRAGAAVVGNSFRSVSRLAGMGWGN
jgi:hypothetical protein